MTVPNEPFWGEVNEEGFDPFAKNISLGLI